MSERGFAAEIAAVVRVLPSDKATARAILATTLLYYAAGDISDEGVLEALQKTVDTLTPDLRRRLALQVTAIVSRASCAN